MTTRPIARWFAALGIVGGCSNAAMAADEPPVSRAWPASETSGDLSDAGEVLAIDEAVEIGRERSFRIARSLRGQESAEMLEADARANYRPRADFSLTSSQTGRAYSFSGQGYSYNESPSPDFWGGANIYVSLPIDVSGVIGRQVDQAELSSTMAGNDVLQSVLDTSYQVRVSYLDALSAQRTEEVDQRVVARLQSLLARAPEWLRPFLQVELGNARQTLSATSAAAEIAMAALRQQLRVDPEAPLVLSGAFMDRRLVFDRAGLLQSAFENRPDMRQLDLRLQQLQINAEQVNDYYRPTVNVSAYYNNSFYGDYFYTEQDERSTNSGVSVGVSVPIARWDNGDHDRQRRRAAMQIEQAQSDAIEMREQVVQQLRQAEMALDRAEQRLADLPGERDAYTAMQNAESDLLSASPEAGQALVAQASNARAAWRAAQMSIIDAQGDYYGAAFRLMRETGLEPETGDAPRAPSGRPVAPEQRPGPLAPSIVDGAGSLIEASFALTPDSAKALAPANAIPLHAAVQLRPVDISDAPDEQATLAATQESVITPTVAQGHSERARQRRPGPLSRFVSFILGGRQRTVVWE